jgi:hypothetical protein
MTIAENFGKLGISISHHEILQIERLVIFFCIRKTHPLTFDGTMIGVDPILFSQSDYNALFDIFKISIKDVEKAIKNTQSIDKNFIVTSDPFNLLCMWLVHLAPIYIKDKRICHEFSMNILRYLHYKFFCSVVNNSFRHGANRGVMEATINSLTKKSDIIRYESWRVLIDTHCERVLDPKDRLYTTILTASPDDKYIKVLAEIQNSIRRKIVIVAQAYYLNSSEGNSVKSMSSISENAEGEKIIAQSASVIDSAQAAMVIEVLNPNVFVQDSLVKDVAEIYSNISERMLKIALLKINEEAVIQQSSRKFDKVDISNGEVTYIGIRALILEIIRLMVSICRTKGVNLGSRVKVFKTVRDAYGSSRTTDPDILAVKRSIAQIIDPYELTTNESSKSALRLAVISYIVYRTILKMKT